MEKLFESAPAIIREAAKSPQGMFALIILVLAVLAFFFFHKSSERTRVVIFVLICISAIYFTITIFRTMDPYNSPMKWDDNWDERSLSQ